jgi:hypothetical protein
MERYEFVKVKRTLTPALSHPMGEGESSSVSLEVVSVGFAGWRFEKAEAFACCPPLPSDGRGVRGEGRTEIK